VIDRGHILAFLEATESRVREDQGEGVGSDYTRVLEGLAFCKLSALSTCG